MSPLTHRIGHPSKDSSIDKHTPTASSSSKEMQTTATDGAGDTGPSGRNSSATGSSLTIDTDSDSEPDESPRTIDHSFWAIRGNLKNKTIRSPPESPNESRQSQLLRFTVVGGRGEREIQLKSSCPNHVAYTVLHHTANDLAIPGSIATAIIIIVTESVLGYQVIAAPDTSMDMLNAYKPKRVYAVYGRVGNQELLEGTTSQLDIADSVKRSVPVQQGQSPQNGIRIKIQYFNGRRSRSVSYSLGHRLDLGFCHIEMDAVSIDERYSGGASE